MGDSGHDALKSNGNLFAPESYWNASDSLRRANCNGCGTAGWKGTLVPDTIYSLPVSESCNIHDWMYAIGTTSAERLVADLVLLANLLSTTDRAAELSAFGRLISPLRMLRCLLYYRAVRRFGEEPFNQASLIGA